MLFLIRIRHGIWSRRAQRTCQNAIFTRIAELPKKREFISTSGCPQTAACGPRDAPHRVGHAYLTCFRGIFICSNTAECRGLSGR